LIVNPVVIFSFFSAFRLAGSLGPIKPVSALPARLAAGLFAGSSPGGWLKLAFQLLGEKLRKNGIHQINLAAGVPGLHLRRMGIVCGPFPAR